VISAHTIAAEIGDGRLVVLDIEGLPIMRRWQVVRRADRRTLPPASAMWDFLVEHAAEHFPALPTGAGGRPRLTVIVAPGTAVGTRVVLAPRVLTSGLGMEVGAPGDQRVRRGQNPAEGGRRRHDGRPNAEPGSTGTRTGTCRTSARSCVHTGDRVAPPVVATDLG